MKKVLLGVLVFIVILFVIGSSGNSKPSTTTASTPPPSSSAAIGDTAYLRNSHSPIMVPVDKTAFNRTMQLSVAGDTTGLARMVVAGDILTVDNGTQVKVISKDYTSTEVRIMSGDHIGESGWVPMEFVSKN